jgi:hypothetical protein
MIAYRKDWPHQKFDGDVSEGDFFVLVQSEDDRAAWLADQARVDAIPQERRIVDRTQGLLFPLRKMTAEEHQTKQDELRAIEVAAWRAQLEPVRPYAEGYAAIMQSMGLSAEATGQEFADATMPLVAAAVQEATAANLPHLATCLPVVANALMGLMMTANLLQEKTGNSVVQTYQACQLDGPPELGQEK